jgi:optic atrophy protein 1
LDRNELFEKAKHQILDKVVKLSQVSPRHWEEVLAKRLWEEFISYIFDTIYLPAAQKRNSGIASIFFFALLYGFSYLQISLRIFYVTVTFNTIVDIKLKEWTENQLPQKSIEIGWDCLQQGFNNFVKETNVKKNHDDIFDNLIAAVFEDAISKFTWEDKVLLI